MAAKKTGKKKSAKKASKSAEPQGINDKGQKLFVVLAQKVFEVGTYNPNEVKLQNYFIAGWKVVSLSATEFANGKDPAAYLVLEKP